MSENQNRGIHELEKYDTMTTEELEEILRSDMDAPEGQELDTEILLYVMEVLANRRKPGHTGKTAHEALESFKLHYFPEVGKSITSREQTIYMNKKPLRWLRNLSAVAAVLVIIFLGSVTAKAFGVDAWKAVVKWTQETFHFADWGQTDNGPRADGELAFSSLQDALESTGIKEKLVPAWIPDGYQLIKITVNQTPLQDIYNAQYKNGEKELKITVRDYLSKAPEYIEQSDDWVETYESLGVVYHLLSNNNLTQAVWIQGSFECYILGDLTIEELKMMIDSIGSPE